MILLVSISDSLKNVRNEPQLNIYHVYPACVRHKRTLVALLGDEVFMPTKVSEKNSKRRVEAVRHLTVKHLHEQVQVMGSVPESHETGPSPAGNELPLRKYDL